MLPVSQMLSRNEAATATATASENRACCWRANAIVPSSSSNKNTVLLATYNAVSG